MIVIKKMENQKVLESINLINQEVKKAYKNSINAKLKKKYEIKIIAISKRQPLERITAALDIGHCIYGENQVQESLIKWPNLKEKYKNIELHLVGPLQSNKAKEAVKIFDVIQTVDREKIAKILKMEEEKQKSGIMPNECDGFFNYCKNDLKLNIQGLMCIPPINEEATIHFAYLRKKVEEYKLPYLSMGMSSDYKKAVHFGATHIRVGEAIFGARP